jgi:hypothetical protein
MNRTLNLGTGTAAACQHHPPTAGRSHPRHLHITGHDTSWTSPRVLTCSHNKLTVNGHQAGGVTETVPHNLEYIFVVHSTCNTKHTTTTTPTPTPHRNTAAQTSAIPTTTTHASERSQAHRAAGRPSSPSPCPYGTRHPATETPPESSEFAAHDPALPWTLHSTCSADAVSAAV